MPLKSPRFVYRPDLALSASGLSSGGAGEGARILVVEDDYLLSVELEAGLTDAGYDVVGVARSAEEALDLALSERPDLVLMDIRLAGKRDGIDAALDIFNRCGIRCVFASAQHDRETRARAEAAAPLGWLAKPYSVESVVVEVRRALSQLLGGD